MRRLVVGCGYLGGRVARLWRGAGDDVYATTRGDNATALSREGLQPLTMDVTRGVLSALPAVDTVVFAVGRAPRSRATMFDIHVEGLRVGGLRSLCASPSAKGAGRAWPESDCSSPTRAGAMRSS